MARLQKITPNLWFDGNAQEAAEFYTSVFKDGKITSTTYYPTEPEALEDFQKDMAGKVLTVEFELAGMRFIAINAGPEFKFNEAVSFQVDCADQAEIDYFWERLSAVPESEVCGWCKDKYGLSWQITPENWQEMMFKEDGSPNAAAYQAMMKMGKLDIAILQAAK